MAKPFQFDCSLEEFEQLHRSIEEKPRKGSSTISVNKNALAALLRDHGRLLALLKAEG